MARTPTCVWRTSAVLLRALDERFGDPLDAYVNGSQTWLVDNGPGHITLEWRLHPVAGYQRPVGIGTYEVFPRVARAVVAGEVGIGTYEVFPRVAQALVAGEVPPAAPEDLWDGLEAFPAHDDEVEPAPLKAAVVEALGIEPDACGMADHDAIGDAWERSGGRVSIVEALLRDLTG